MIRLMETCEMFSDVYEAREAVLRYAREKAKGNQARATLVLDAKTYTLREPLAFDADEIPELKNVELSLIGQGGPAVLTSGRALPLSKIKKEENIYTYQLEAEDRKSVV